MVSVHNPHTHFNIPPPSLWVYFFQQASIKFQYHSTVLSLFTPYFMERPLKLDKGSFKSEKISLFILRYIFRNVISLWSLVRTNIPWATITFLLAIYVTSFLSISCLSNSVIYYITENGHRRASGLPPANIPSVTSIPELQSKCAIFNRH